ncbi:uncharacterized protein LOC122724947 [Manihot esculenta]|uniref:Uncharacterized protein n=1 Tax=Manihot esculenta TaxID=3983 RepID=A0ACB7H1S2_MANES|nr:uncharacterized protein LOC122724947 [Manihot esculenta]KAG8645693.1 hypothetical protein MANES_10G084701v8 [Manihot esculenta]
MMQYLHERFKEWVPIREYITFDHFADSTGFVAWALCNWRGLTHLGASANWGVAELCCVWRSFELMMQYLHERFKEWVPIREYITFDHFADSTGFVAWALCNWRGLTHLGASANWGVAELCCVWRSFGELLHS